MPDADRTARPNRGAPGRQAARLLALSLACPLVLIAQQPAPRDSTTAPVVKHASATRVPNGAIVVDGRLDEGLWKSLPAITDFLEKQPHEGAEPAERTEIRLAYDDAALYVGARMYAKDPSKVQAPVGRRDNTAQMEQVVISLDTYRDRRTAYSFGVTASGVRSDFYVASDDQMDTNASFDPVWDGRAHRDALGWTAEMRIPFNQLRFNAADQQLWGVNFNRWIPSTNEDIFWIPIPSNVTAWASRMGTLEGISGIQPSWRVELLPYVAGEGSRNSDRDRRDPFDDGRNLDSRVGADVKMGLGPSLTLQATVNPDFGQVEADPSVVNLSAYELFFSEKRPFFTEGGQFLSGGGATYFYSRRIGGRPRSVLDADFVDAPNATTILGAAKLTGRLASGLSIGALAAATDRETASGYFLPDPLTATPERRVHETVQPRADYGVVRLRQELGRSGSTAGMIITAVHRALGARDALAAILPRDAIAGASDFNLRFRDGEYQLTGTIGGSHIAGDSLAIVQLQRSSARYYQRPDAHYVRLDSTRTSLNGFNSYLEMQRTNGRHWLWDALAGARSPGFDVNDAGAMSVADEKFLDGILTWREKKPNAYFQDYRISLETYGQLDFGNVRNAAFVRSDATLTFRNFWYANLTAWQDLPSQSGTLTRGGPYMGTGYYRVGIVEVGNSFASPTRWSGRVYYGRSTLGENTERYSGSFGFRAGPQWQVTVAPNYLVSRDPRQYVGTASGAGPAETSGKSYQFATIDFHEFTLSSRLNYSFSPDLTLEMFVEPYAASGSFAGLGELTRPRSRETRGIGGDPSALDFNERSLRTNAVLRWEWRPGSLFYAVWQRSGSRSLERFRPVDPTDAFGAFGGRYTNFFALKMSLWVPLGG
ncbi:MAG: DUF5916 domain-containing protein [Gemmatimonadaceae bacterium]